MERVGIIDLGSNTTRLIVMAHQPGRCFKMIDEVRETVRLAEGVGDNNMLHPAAMQRSIDALRMFRALCDSTGVGTVIATGTSALRDAANQQEFLQRLKDEAGLDMRVLSGEEEAYYGFLGVVNSLPVSDGYMVDIGGGSTEIAEIRAHNLGHSISQAVGTVRFGERYITSDPPGSKEIRALQKAVDEAFANVDWFSNAEGRVLVGVGGTVRNLARMDQKSRKYPLGRMHGYTLTASAIDTIISQLKKRTSSERASIAGLNSDRADVILPGALILRQLMDKGGFDSVLVGGQGLREGLFYEQFLALQPRPVFDDVRAANVQNMAQLYNYEETHAHKVRALSYALFDQLQLLHSYGDWERELLGHAAILHDIGVEVSYYDHHKHSEYLLLNTGLPGFTHREVAIIALLVRSHRKGSVPLDNYEGVLGEGDNERVMILAALLRLAEFLERSKSQLVRNLHIKADNGTILIEVESPHDALVELWHVNQRTSLFKKAFGRDIEVVQVEAN